MSKTGKATKASILNSIFNKNSKDKSKKPNFELVKKQGQPIGECARIK